MERSWNSSISRLRARHLAVRQAVLAGQLRRWLGRFHAGAHGFIGDHDPGLCRWTLLCEWGRSPALRELAGSLPQVVELAESGQFGERMRGGARRGSWRSLARTPRSGLAARVGLPATRQMVKLHCRVPVNELGEALPLLATLAADPTALRWLSQSRGELGVGPLSLLASGMPVHRRLFAALDGRDKFVRDRLVKRIRKARDDPDGDFVWRLGRITSVGRLKTELGEVERRRRLRGEDLDPEVRAAFPVVPPIPAGGRIRAVTELEELLAISMDEHLCLVDYVEQVALGRYAVYRIEDAGGPVTIGLNNDPDAGWVLHQMRGPGNSEPEPEAVAEVEEWLGGQTPDRDPGRNG